MQKVHELTLMVKFFKWIGFSTTSSNGVAIRSENISSISGRAHIRLTRTCIKKKTDMILNLNSYRYSCFTVKIFTCSIHLGTSSWIHVVNLSMTTTKLNTRRITSFLGGSRECNPVSYINKQAHWSSNSFNHLFYKLHLSCLLNPYN